MALITLGYCGFALITLRDEACVSRPQLHVSHLQPLGALITLGCFGMALISLGCCDAPQPLVALFPQGCRGVALFLQGHCGVAVITLGCCGLCLTHSHGSLPLIARC